MNELSTTWRGSAFNCPSSSNGILVLNSTVGSEPCNNEMIIVRIIRRKDDNYTSQLNVILSSDLIGKSIECASYNGSHYITISNTTLDIRMWDDMYTHTSLPLILFTYMQLPNTAPFPPPDEVSIAQVNFGTKKVTLSWSPVALDYPAIHYNILASNCGSCPTTTNHTNVTCTDLPSDDSMCNFAIQTVVCGNITGNWSKPLTFNVTNTLMNEITSYKKGVLSIIRL